MPEFAETKQEKKLDELRSKEAEELAMVLAQKYQLPYIDLSKLPINTDALRIIPEADARGAGLAAFKITGKILFIALVSPNPNSVKKILQELQEKGYRLNLYLASAASLTRAWERYGEISSSSQTEAGVIDLADETIHQLLEKLTAIDEIAAVFAAENQTTLKGSGTSQALEVILAGAIKINASDIHLEPGEENTRLRYRLDGVLHDLALFDVRLYQQILARVKLISGLKLNIKKSAQDGRFSIRLPNGEIEIRTSLLPGAYGESIVLRILNPETIAIPFEELGIETKLLSLLEQEIGKPNGLILLTGPTGSGKTTTLYAFLKKINSPETKIITIEDPIEYHLKGVNQTQVNRDKGYTFLSGLRSALRQDPDVIMVGEIRDGETARIALNASLTGHLVFSTLHTNNAWGVVPRLIDLGINAKIIDAALRLSLAQRLVRKLCPQCKKETPATADEKKLIENILIAVRQKRTDLNPHWSGVLWQAGGCRDCQQTGYRGRIGIFEAVTIDPAVAAILDKNPNEREIRLASEKQGLLDMREDGILKAIAGITSLAELNRVVDLNPVL